MQHGGGAVHRELQEHCLHAAHRARPGQAECLSNLTQAQCVTPGISTCAHTTGRPVHKGNFWHDLVAMANLGSSFPAMTADSFPPVAADNWAVTSLPAIAPHTTSGTASAERHLACPRLVLMPELCARARARSESGLDCKVKLARSRTLCYLWAMLSIMILMHGWKYIDLSKNDDVGYCCNNKVSCIHPLSHWRCYCGCASHHDTIEVGSSDYRKSLRKPDDLSSRFIVFTRAQCLPKGPCGSRATGSV